MGLALELALMLDQGLGLGQGQGQGQGLGWGWQIAKQRSAAVLPAFPIQGLQHLNDYNITRA